jgi:carotenoid cleavage dioxygenase-like enzyme
MPINNQFLNQSFPRSIFSVSREEFYGQDEEHQPLKLIVKKGLTEETTQLPEELYGHVFIVAAVGSLDSPGVDRQNPLIVTPSADGLTSLFNGDGMIYRLDFHSSSHTEEMGAAWLACRIAKTPDYYLEEAVEKKCQQFPDNEIWQSLQFKNWGLARFSLKLGSRNQLNTAFVRAIFPNENERLLVTWDTGRPYEVDPRTLNLVAPIGSNQDWLPLVRVFIPQPFPAVATSAHPAFDYQTGELFTVNMSRTLLSLLRLPRLLSFGSAWLANLLARIPTGSKGTFNKKNIKKLFVSKPMLIVFNGSHSLSEKLKHIPEDSWQEKVKFFLLWPLRLLGKITVDLIRFLVWLLAGFLDFILHAIGIDRGEDRIDLIRWQGQETVEKWQLLLPPGSKIRQTVHQMGITEKYLVLVDTAFKLAPEAFVPGWLTSQWLNVADELRNFLTYPQSSNTDFYIIDRADLQPGVKSVRAKKVTVPREIAHYEVDYACPNDCIVVHAGNVCASDPAEYIRRYDESAYSDEQEFNNIFAGMSCSPMDVNLLGCYLIDGKKGKLLRDPERSYQYDANITWSIAIAAYRYDRPLQQQKIEDIFWNTWGSWADLLTEDIYDMYRNYEYRKISVDEIKNNIALEGMPPSLIRAHISRNGMTSLPQINLHPDRYSFPEGYFGNSPTFIPRKNSQGSTNGYLACVVAYSDNLLSDRNDNWSNNSELWIFDANNLQAGPLYRLSHPKLNLGLTIHSVWLENLTVPPVRNYDVVRDYQEIVDTIVSQNPEVGEEIREMFVREVFPRV